MVEFEIIDFTCEKDEIVSLNIENMKWANKKLNELYNLPFVEKIRNNEESFKDYSRESINKLLNSNKPRSRFIVVKEGTELIGMGCLNQFSEDIGEIKRMYVRKEFRNRGIGLQLLNKLLDIGLEMNFSTIRLDSGNFMVSAHKLYKKVGFKMIDPYPGSEIPPENQKYAVFMEKRLQ